jgi:hypothetical protein
MSDIFRTVAEKLGYRQKAYQSVFGGSAMQMVLVDLAAYSKAFDADTDGLSHDALMAMHGRRQMFFRILNHMKLSPIEIEQVYRPALMQAAARLQRTHGADND